MKRFYKLVSTAREGSEFTVKLDDKPIHTPARNLLKIPNEAIADLIAQEWHVQSDPIIPDTMPLTQIIISAYDRITPQRDVLHNEIMPYLHTDLLCYRTDYPEDLGKQQAKTWDPHLKNIKKLFGHDVLTTTGLLALEQQPELYDKIDEYIRQLDIWHFTALYICTMQSGSLFLGLLFLEGKATPAKIIKARFVEETYKGAIYDEKKYGPDPQHAKHRKNMTLDLKSLQKFLELLRN